MFYVIAGGAALLTALLMIRPLISGRSDVAGRDAADAQVFRDQLDEIERDLERGTISAQEAEGARIEVSRRLIAATQRAETSGGIAPAPQGSSGLIAGVALMGTPALAIALYMGLGVPGMPDQPLAERATRSAGGLPAQHPQASRPSQETVEAQYAAEMPPAPQSEDNAEYEALVARLETMIETRPDDIEGHRLLSDALMRLGRWSEAWRMYDATITLMGEKAGADLYANQAEGMVLAAGGYVSPKAEIAIGKALERDPTLPMARYYAGLSLRQAGLLDDAITMWEGLRRDSPPDAPWLEWLNMMLSETVQARDGKPAGPNAADIAAADEMTPEERVAMVEGMVQRLEDRLTSQGGTPEDWARLMSSYSTLNKTEDAKRALGLALAANTGADADALRKHAAQLGITGDAAPAATASTAAPAGTPTPATPAPGPSAEQIQEAQALPAADRMEMVRGMVQRLADRLASEGGSAEEWGRLMTSHIQLDQTDEAMAAYQNALAAYPSGPDNNALRAHAQRIGLVAAAPGPTQEQMQAAQEMPADDRMAMIEGMVVRLEERLTTDGGQAEEWIRLMRSYMTLQRKDDAGRIYKLGYEALDNDPSRGFFREQALLMGVPTE